MNEYDTYISLTVSMLSTRDATWSAHLVQLIFEMAHVREKVGHPCSTVTTVMSTSKMTQIQYKYNYSNLYALCRAVV